MSSVLKLTSYESILFLTRRLAGIPGYQYKVDLTKEFHQNQIFTPAELKKIFEKVQKVPGEENRRHIVFDEKFHLFEIKRQNENKLERVDEKSTKTFPQSWNANDFENLVKFLHLEHGSEVSVTEIQEENFETYLNDHKFLDLSSNDKRLVKFGLFQLSILKYQFMRTLLSFIYDILNTMMEKYLKNLEKSPCEFKRNCPC